MSRRETPSFFTMDLDIKQGSSTNEGGHSGGFSGVGFLKHIGVRVLRPVPATGSSMLCRASSRIPNLECLRCCLPKSCADSALLSGAFPLIPLVVNPECKLSKGTVRGLISDSVAVSSILTCQWMSDRGCVMRPIELGAVHEAEVQSIELSTLPPYDPEGNL